MLPFFPTFYIKKVCNTSKPVILKTYDVHSFIQRPLFSLWAKNLFRASFSTPADIAAYVLSYTVAKQATKNYLLIDKNWLVKSWLPLGCPRLPLGCPWLILGCPCLIAYHMPGICFVHTSLSVRFVYMSILSLQAKLQKGVITYFAVITSCLINKKWNRRGIPLIFLMEAMKLVNQ